MPAIVMLTSLFENNKFENIKVYILYSKLSIKEKTRLLKHINKYKQKVVFKKIDPDIFKNFPILGKFKKENYYRLLIWEILPNKLERALYLDSDIIVNKSLKKFYYQDLENYYFIACEDKENASKESHKRLTLPLNRKYFNSGVILYNLKINNKSTIKSDIFKWVRKNSNKICYVDQDVLNALFYDKVKFDDYNLFNLFVQEYKIPDLKETKIYHYVGRYKPWNYSYTGKLDSLFWSYAKKSGYNFQYLKYKLLNYIYRKFIHSKVSVIKSIVSFIKTTFINNLIIPYF